MLNEAREEDAEGMLRPKPKEQPMPKLCEAWATWNVGICGVVETERRRMKLPLSLVRSENGIRERTLDALGRTQNRQPFGLSHVFQPCSRLEQALVLLMA